MFKLTFASFVLLCGLADMSAQGTFKPATFNGLLVGRATISQATKQFGPPKDQFNDSTGTTWTYYENIGPVRGRVEMISNSKSGVIERISILPEGIYLDSVKAILGTNLRSVRYDFDKCLGNGEAAPLFEAPDGPLEYLVYDDLGVALRNKPRTGVISIEYLGKPLGSKVSKCKPVSKGSNSAKGKR